jgi:hypothetical protein
MSDTFETTEFPSFGELDGRFPVEQLQLRVHAQNICREHNCRTITELVESLRSGKLTPVIVGKKTYDELRSAVLEVHSLCAADGNVDWERVWDQREVITPCLAMTSGALERVTPHVREMGLGALHLRKACSGLSAAGIRTVGGLIDAARKGIGKLDNFGKRAQGEVIAALRELSKSTNHEGAVDWESFAIAQGFALLPANAETSGNAAELLKSLPAFCEKVVAAQFNERAWEIFKRRLMVPEKSRETLEELGTVYGVTRERIRQIEESCLDALRTPIFRDNYRGLEFRLRPATVALFRDAREHLKSLGLPAWTESNWLGELATLWGVGTMAVQRFDRLLVETLSFRWFGNLPSPLEPLIIDDTTPRPEAEQLAAAVVAVHEALLDNCQGLDSFGLVRALRGRGIAHYGLEDVPVLIELCSTAEAAGGDTGLYRTTFASLKGRADQVVRLLLEAGKPLYRSDLLREVNRRLPSNRRLQSECNLVNQLSPDERLHPIGKSGEWALSEWSIEGRSLIEIMEDVLASSGEALPTEEIVRQVLERRPGATASISMLLQFNPDRFRRVARGVYGLAAWGDKAPDGAMSDEFIARFIEDYVTSHGGGAVDFKEIRRAFEAATGLGPRSAAGILAAHPALEVGMENSYIRTAKFQKCWRTKPVERPYQRSVPLQVELIVEQAVQMLWAEPAGELPLSEVVKALEKKLGVGRPNIYAAIGQASEIEKVKVEGSVFKIVRLRNGKQPSFPQIEKLRNVDWREECRRALANLTLADVDIGLFILGRQFDKATTCLLEAGRAAGRPVSEKDLNRLNARIEWALAQDVFRDKASLNLLRIERNERGHQPPTLEEREAILKFAPFLAGLYLDYLIMIEDRIEHF